MKFVVYFIDTFFELLSIAIIARILMSWFRVNPSGMFYKFIRDVTEPILGTIRKIMPRTGMIDFSPLIALIAIDLLGALIIRLLIEL